MSKRSSSHPVLPILAILCLLAQPSSSAQETPRPMDYEVKLETVTSEFNGDFCWFHPRAGAVPGAGKNGAPAVIMVIQKWFVDVSDYFSGLSIMRTDDMGASWTGPREEPGLGWRDEGKGTTVGICDFTPGYHASSGKLIAIGHTVRYENGHLMKDPRPREVGYAVCNPQTGQWAPWKMVDFPDKSKFFSAGAGCAQWLAEPDGALLVPFYFKGKSDKPTACYATTVMRCAFDGETLTYLEHGSEHPHNEPRGYYEPSLTFFQGRYYITIRNDKRAYVTSGDDGLHYADPKPWTFDDGAEIGSYNTQQHWVTHSDALFLAYTRRGADNDHIPRHRAPLFIAQVDPERLCLLRKTERILIPERGAMMGNFGVATVNEQESWVTVGEGMFSPKCAERGADGSVFAARIIWSTPNKLAGRVR